MTLRHAIFGRALPLLLGGMLMLASESALAVATVPQYTSYGGYLLDSSGRPMSGQFRIRFSYWNTADALSGDRSGSGVLNTGAASYLGWQEVDLVDLGNKGSFSVQLGKTTPLPNLSTLKASDLRSLHLQVEVKNAGSPDVEYELLDPNPSDSTVDRSPVLPTFFAINADRLDGRDIGTGSGSIAMFGSGAVLMKAQIPNGTNAHAFTIDADNNATSTINLTFGSVLAKKLSFDIPNGWFVFNDDVKIEGNLTVTGLINGVNITSLATSNAPLKVSSGAGLAASINAGNYQLNGTTASFTGTSATLSGNADNYLFFTGTGGLQVRTGGFPSNISFIPLAKVTTNGSGVTSVTDQRVLQSDNREHSVLEALHPGYPGAAYDADGSSNVGQLSVDTDAVSKNNYYQWTSTKSGLNDYDVVLRYTLPQKFVRWQGTPLTLFYRTSSADAAISKADIFVFDTAGNAVTLVGSSTALASTSWTSTSLTFSGSPAWTAGQSFIVKIRMYAKDAATVHIGDLELKTVKLDRE